MSEVKPNEIQSRRALLKKVGRYAAVSAESGRIESGGFPDSGRL
jgi:hypothetical protein